MKMTVIPVVIDAFGTVRKRGGKRTERIENDSDTNSNTCIRDGPKGLERGRKELKMTVIPIVIDAFGTVRKGVERGRKN